jgi:hypothetical protein
MSKIEVDAIEPQSGTSLTLGASGDTLTIPSGATLVNNGTASGFGDNLEWQSSIVTASTITVTANKGYWIDTTSNACTITLPAAAAVGDRLIFTDYARNWATNAVTINQNSLNFQGNSSPNPVYDTNGESIDIVYSGATKGWIPNTDGAVALETEQTYSADFLVIAGGGGGAGGNHGSGGGAGGYRTSTQGVTPGSTITVTVGDGGTGNNDNTNNGGNGSDSSISGTGLTTITSTGGGGGGAVSNGTSPAGTGSNGGSGGGGSARSDGATSVGGISSPVTSPVQGYAGGGNGGYAGSPYPGSGGGGAGGVGGNATSNSNAGAGAGGASSSITGAAVTRAGGGGGTVYPGGTAGAGGSGGGGAGGLNGSGTAGTINTGSGGGGGGGGGTGTGGNGGKGVVILSMPDADYSGTTTGSPTVATGVSGKTILTFTGSGSYTG